MANPQGVKFAKKGPLSGDLEQLQTSYRVFNDEKPDEDDEDEPPSYQHQGGSPWYNATNNTTPHRGGGDEAPAGGVIIHTVPEGSKSRWSHIEDLDSFFKNIYTYHQRHGFRVMVMQKLCELVQVVFIIFLSVYLFDCVHYDVLFNNKQPEGKQPGEKVTLYDVTMPLGKCANTLSFKTWVFLLVALSFWTVKMMAVVYQVFQFWDIKLFYNQALGIADHELDSVTWREVQKRLVEAQSDYLMCIHKEQLTDLDIYHRILRFKNYMVAMVNKDILPVRLHMPFTSSSVIFLSHGLKFNFEWLFFKGPWAPFDKWHLKDDYKRIGKKKELTEHLSNRILIVGLVNLLLMPLILFWQVLYCFFNYAELLKREPGSLGVRKWNHYGRLYLRHFNELDHELSGRLNRAYKPANQYMEIFVSPVSAVLAKFFTFLSGSVLAVFLTLSIWDEDVLNVEHVLTIITFLTATIAVSRVFVPDENMVFCPEKTLTAVLAHIHYFPDTWKGQAHTYTVMSELGDLFPYTAVALLQEVLSPVVTPFVLLFMLRPKASSLVDFFRNFTVDVVGVGDVCSFAQMDVRRHGNPNWQNTEVVTTPQPQPKTNNYTQAEDGKTEMSLIHFTLTNPDWKPPQESEHFINALRGQAAREAETLPALPEDQLEDNPLYTSLTSLEAAGGVYASLAQEVLTGQHVLVSRNQQQQSLLQSVHQGLAAGRTTNASSLMTTMPPPPNLRQDLKRLGLEYTAADMSLSALYLHEMHHRSSSGNNRRNNTTYQTSSLTELDEETTPLVDVSAGNEARLAASNVA